MINKNTRPIKGMVKVTTITLCAALAAGAAICIASIKPASDTYTTYADNGYFSQTTYYRTEEAYEEHLKAAYPEQKQYRAVSSKLNANEEEDEQFVMGAVKSVWVAEEYDEDGNVTESHLMSKEEMENNGIPVSPASLKDPSYNFHDDSGGGSLDKTIGEDSEKFHYLSIELSVTQDVVTKEYTANGVAGWDKKLTSDSSKAAEKYSPDYLGITWGGENTLKMISQSITGVYHSGLFTAEKPVDFARSTSDSYAGYVWLFFEKSEYMGKEMKRAEASVTFESIGELKNKETCVKLTYIHTYDRYVGEPSIEASSDGTVAAGISMSVIPSQWQIEIDIGGIEY